MTTSFPLRPAESSGIFVSRLVEAYPNSISSTVICPADTKFVAKRRQTQALIAIRYAPRAWQTLAQQPGGIIAGLRARPFSIFLLPLLLTSFVWHVRRESRRNDVVHANWAICGLIVRLAMAFKKKPVVLTLRGDDVTLAKKSVIHRIILLSAVSRAAQVVCVADSMLKNLLDLCPSVAPRACVILNGVGNEFLKLRLPVHREEKAIQLLAVGSLIKRKGYDLLFRALALCRTGEYQLTVVGEGPENQALRDLAQELKIDSYIVFVGSVDPDQIPRYFEESDVLVFPSRSEGRPNVVIEAMAASRPVVAFAIAGVTDLIRSNEEGWLAEPGNISDFARVLQESISNSFARIDRGKRARERVLNSEWTWDATGHKYGTIFEQLANRSVISR